MKHIYSIAKNTFRETIRDRILYGMVIFSLLFFFLVAAMSGSSLGEDPRIMKSLGLGGMYLFGTFIAIFLASSAVAKEVDRRTFFFILPRPVSRPAVLTGKFFGIVASTACSIMILLIGYYIAEYFTLGYVEPVSALSSVLQVAEAACLISVIIFFSTFVRPVLAIFAGIALLFVGHSWSTMIAVAGKISPLAMNGAIFASYLLPNLEKFNIRESIVYGFSLSMPQIIFALLYSIFASAFFLYAAGTIFKRTEF